ncbi:MAG: N-6 DNA methylase [Desulfobacteraceae bacterium]|nr:N-6 DNA methylase [Desulfobacteraceae bacterium]
MLLNNPEINSQINKLWDTFWSGGIANPLTAIEQITYLLFMKKLDELDLKRQQDAEFAGDSYTSIFKGRYEIPGTENNKGKRKTMDKQKLRWSHFKHISPSEKMLEHVQNLVFPFIKTLNGGTAPFTRHMANAVFIIPKPSLLVEATKIIDKIFDEIEKDAEKGGHTFQDIQGDVYEMLLNEIAQAGKNGQFRTPRHIIKLISELVNPQLGHRIADPACGTSGFLLGAYQHIIKQLDKKKGRKKLDDDGFTITNVSGLLTEKVKMTLDQSLYGFDFDLTMVRLGLMNLMMHGIDNPQIEYKDTLSKGYNEDSMYDIVMANPPFTGSIDKGDINETLALPTTKTELLFTERMFNMLKTGGTAGFIVPQGVLFGAAKAFVQARKKLIEEAELKAVITMPSGVFKPYAGVSTAILIFTKGGETEHVWFYDMQSDGYSLDDKRAKLDGYGDLHDIVIRYKKRNPKKDTDRKEKYFFVSKKEIVENNYDLSVNQYKEDIYEEIKYEKPKAIIKKINKIESDIISEIVEIEKIL